MNPVFKIFNKVIKKNSPTLIIAEIGINHMGSEELCKNDNISIKEVAQTVLNYNQDLLRSVLTKALSHIKYLKIHN